MKELKNIFNRRGSREIRAKMNCYSYSFLSALSDISAVKLSSWTLSGLFK
jgi:hypothetical protein